MEEFYDFTLADISVYSQLERQKVLSETSVDTIQQPSKCHSLWAAGWLA
jgi:hypothetical protein